MLICLVQVKKQVVKKTRDEILREKRERERERRRKIREDPVKNQEQKDKERQRYLKQKQNHVKKSVKEMTPREQRLIRKKWKENSKNYRLKKNQIEMEISMLEANTPPPQYLLMKKTTHQLQICHFNDRSAERLPTKTKLLRKTKPKRSPDLTPVTKLNLLLGASAIEHPKVEEVKKTLLFGEVVQQQLANTYQQLKSDQKKQVFKKMLDGTVLKKYKMRTKLSTVMKFRKSSTYDSKDIMSFERKKSEYIRRNNIIKQKIKDFLELEDNSPVCPGKKEFVKKNKVKKQKHIYCSTYAEDCLLHKCDNCKNAKPHFKEYNGCIRLQYFQWVHLTQNYFDKKHKLKIAKQPNDVEAAELVTIFMNKLPILLSHEGRVLHQHHSISELKKTKS
nr:unnamed protein product [Callosobruchus analis]